MKRILILNILFLIASLTVVNAQTGKTFAEFAQTLEQYFDKTMIDDIKKQLPLGSDYKIWGWDVGDFSGDGIVDCAFSLNLKADKKRRMHVYLFTDIDGFLTKVGHFTYNFIDTPLEIGVAIKNSACAITQKNEDFNWNIDSYTYDNGVVLRTETYHTRRIGDLTYQKNRNYQSLTSTEKYLYTQSNDEAFFRMYNSLVSYPRNKKVFKGYQTTTTIDDIDFVYTGAWHWSGAKDLSYKAKSSYDEEYLYFTVEVTDEKIIPELCDSCICDHIELWLDLNKPDSLGDRFMTRKDNRILFRSSTEKGLIKFIVKPGDFVNTSADIEINTNDEFSTLQWFETRKMKAISNLTNDGYIIKFKIPFTVLGYNGSPMAEQNDIEIGACISVIDYDNKFRPEEKTEIANSSFVSYNPTSYGSLIFIPKDSWYGESFNIFEMEILQAIREYGF
jgi:hypothetical protein